MSNTNNRKGYAAERAIEVLLQTRYPQLASNILRPRAGAPADKGDIHGLPVVISIKNWSEPSLGPWVNEMQKMCHNAGKGVGVVWHKRRGRGKPHDWYVTMDQQSFDALRDKYEGTVFSTHAGVVVSGAKLQGWLNVAGRNRADQPGVLVLVHNRTGRGDKFITTYGEDFLTLLDAYVKAGRDRGLRSKMEEVTRRG